MNKSKRTFIAKEGRIYIWVMVFAGIVAVHSSYFLAAFFFFITASGLAVLFRGSDRSVPPSPLAVVSPVDGVVSLVQSCHDRYLNREAIRIVIKPNLFGEYVVRGPIEGKIHDHWVRERGNSSKQLAREYSYWIQTDEEDDVVIVLRPRLWLRPIWYIHVGERIGQGQRGGFLKFGGKIEVLIPATSRLKVSVGDRVQSGSGILAALRHE